MPLLQNKAPAKIQEKAIKILEQFNNRLIFPSRINYNGHLYFKVSMRWRLYSMDRGVNWLLLDYDNFLKTMEKHKRVHA